MTDVDVPLFGLESGVLLLSETGEITGIDPVACEILDRPADALVGSYVHDLLDTPRVPLEELQKRMREEPTASDCRGCELTLCRTIDEGKWYGLVHDLRGVSRMLYMGARKEARKEASALISGFAHEVRNPIAAILSMTEALLHSSKCSDFVREMVEPVPGLIRRIEGVISDSVSYSRPDEATPSRLDAERIIAGVLKNHPPPEKVQVRVDANARTPMILGDPWHTRRILRALLENAYESGASGIEIGIDAFPESGARKGVSITVTDDGSGVDEQVREKIFRPFFTTRAQHTGLGLAMARNLARLNRGGLRLREADDGRTCFELLLPENVNSNLDEVDQHGV